MLNLDTSGAALGRVHTGSVNPWISRIFAKHPMKFDIKSDPSRIVNPWIEIPNVVTVITVSNIHQIPIHVYNFYPFTPNK